MEYPVMPRNIFKRLIRVSNKQSTTMVLLYLSLICSKHKQRRGYVEPGKFNINLCSAKMGIDRKSVYNGLNELEAQGFIIINPDSSIFILDFYKGFYKGMGGSFTIPELVYSEDFASLPWVLQRAFLHILYRTTSCSKIIRIGAPELMALTHLNCPGRVEEYILKNLEGLIYWQSNEHKVYEITLADTGHVIADDATLDELYPETYKIIINEAAEQGFETEEPSDYLDLLQLTLQYTLEETKQALRIFQKSFTYDTSRPVGAYLRGIIKKRRENSFTKRPVIFSR